MFRVKDNDKIICCVTGSSREVSLTPAGRPRPPRGWKRIGTDYYSPEAWHDRYCVRAVIVPVASPAPVGKGSQEKWMELRTALAGAWELSTEAANWALKRLLANDVTRAPGETKCPKMPPIYLYGQRDWTGWSQSASAVLRTIESNYRSRRYEIVWRGGQSLPNVRYPYPYPIHNAAWNLEELADGGGLMFGARLPAGRVQMRLRGGHRYRRQLLGARHLIQHPELRGEASIYKRRNEIMVKLVGWFPRRTDEDLSGTLFLRTDPESFLIGLNERDERLFVINGDRCKDWINRHSRWMQRWREDMKYEKRRPKRDSRKFAEDMKEKCRKNRHRVNTFVNETAAECVNHARRRRLAKIVLSDADHSFMPDAPWHRLVTGLEQRANTEGIGFERLRAEEKDEAARNAVTTEEV